VAHNYVGADDPAAIVPAIPIAGKGVFPIAEVTDDQDDRDAGSAMAGIEANADKINWLVWRMINIVDGATTAFTTAIQISNPWTTLGRFVLSGVNAWMAHRAAIHVSGADATFTLTDGDTFVVDGFTHGATRTYTLAPPASNKPALYRFRIRADATGTTRTDVGVVRFKLAGSAAGVYIFTYTPTGIIDAKLGWSMDLEYESATGLIAVCSWSQNNIPTLPGGYIGFP
jgi:hypothetical protein